MYIHQPVPVVPIDVKFVISSSIFTKNNEFQFFILIFKPHLMVYLCSLEDKAVDHYNICSVIKGHLHKVSS